MDIANLKVGDRILYDRFEGLEPAMPGVIDGFARNRDKTYVWVDCDGERFMTPITKLSMDVCFHRKL